MGMPVHCRLCLGMVRLECTQWGKMVCCGAIRYFVGGVCTVKLSLYIVGHVEVLRTRSVCWESFLYVVGQILVL